MSDQADILTQRVVLIQVPPELEQAARAGDVAALPPGPEQIQARNAVFAGDANAQGHQPTEEERQAALAMALLYGQQLALGCATKGNREEETPEQPRLEDEEDAEDA